MNILSIAFAILSIFHFIVSLGYQSILSWIFLVASLLMCYFMFQYQHPKSHRNILILIIAYYLVHSMLTLESFVRYPIPFNNTSQIIFTIGLNLAWLVIYLYVMYHKEDMDSTYVFYIVTVVLIIFKSFSNSIRLVTFVRGYLSDPLSVLQGFLLVVLTILMTFMMYMMFLMYLNYTNQKLDLKINKKV